MAEKGDDARQQMVKEVGAVLGRHPEFQGRVALADIPGADAPPATESGPLNVDVPTASRKVCVKWGIDPVTGRRVCLKWVDA